jgi:hypothetical protein
LQKFVNAAKGNRNRVDAKFRGKYDKNIAYLESLLAKYGDEVITQEQGDQLHKILSDYMKPGAMTRLSAANRSSAITSSAVTREHAYSRIKPSIITIPKLPPKPPAVTPKPTPRVRVPSHRH